MSVELPISVVEQLLQAYHTILEKDAIDLSTLENPPDNVYANEVFKYYRDDRRRLFSNYSRVWDTKTKSYKIYKTSPKGYKSITVCDNKTTIHRITAELFVPKDPNHPERVYVDHISRDRGDNYYKNLQWVSPKENSHDVCKAVELSRDGFVTFTRYKSSIEAAEAIGCKHHSRAITSICKGRLKTTSGYTARYSSTPNEKFLVINELIL